MSLRSTGDATDLWSESHTFASGTDSLVVAVGLRTPTTDTTQTPPAPELEKRLDARLRVSVDRTAPVGNRARIIVVNGFVRQAGDPTPSVDFRNPDDPPTTDVANLAFGGFHVARPRLGDGELPGPPDRAPIRFSSPRPP